MITNTALIKKIRFHSAFKVDQVIGTFEDSFTIAAATTTIFQQTATKVIPTGFNVPTFFVGIYSIDNGVTWNDFTNIYMMAGFIFPLFEAHGRSTPGNMTIIANNYYDSIAGSVPYTVRFKVALIAPPGMGAINPLKVGAKRYFYSGYNYQKIYKDNVQDVSLGSLVQGVYGVNHNLGYIPKIRQYLYQNSSQSIVQLFTDITGSGETTISTTDITDTLNAPLLGISGKLYTRVYYDN